MKTQGIIRKFPIFRFFPAIRYFILSAFSEIFQA
jgi:hypothetical protein